MGCPNDGVRRGVWTVLDKVSKRCQAGCPGAVGWGVPAVLGRVSTVKHLVSTQTIVIALPCHFFLEGAL